MEAGGGVSQTEVITMSHLTDFIQGISYLVSYFKV